MITRTITPLITPALVESLDPLSSSDHGDLRRALHGAQEVRLDESVQVHALVRRAAARRRGRQMVCIHMGDHLRVAELGVTGATVRVAVVPETVRQPDGGRYPLAAAVRELCELSDIDEQPLYGFGEDEDEDD